MKISRQTQIRFASAIIAGSTMILVDGLVVRSISKELIFATMPLRTFGIFALGVLIYAGIERGLFKFLVDKDTKSSE